MLVLLLVAVVVLELLMLVVLLLMLAVLLAMLLLLLLMLMLFNASKMTSRSPPRGPKDAPQLLSPVAPAALNKYVPRLAARRAL